MSRSMRQRHVSRVLYDSRAWSLGFEVSRRCFETSRLQENLGKSRPRNRLEQKVEKLKVSVSSRGLVPKRLVLQFIFNDGSSLNLVPLIGMTERKVTVKSAICSFVTVVTLYGWAITGMVRPCVCEGGALYISISLSISKSYTALHAVHSRSRCFPISTHRLVTLHWCIIKHQTID